MFDLNRSIRLWITAGILVGAFALLRTASHGEPIVARQPLRELSYTLENWTGEEHPLQKQIVQAVMVSDYTNRVYLNPDGRAGSIVYRLLRQPENRRHDPFAKELPAGSRVGPYPFWLRQDLPSRRASDCR